MSKHRRRFIALHVIAFATSTPTIESQAQRSQESAIAAAEDSFGLTVGAETIGLYNSNSVRGFSPAVAANVRLDGLYMDVDASPSARISTGSTIRAGINAIAYLFPAPTGVLDYGLIDPSPGSLLSVRTGIDHYLSPFLQMDYALGTDTWSQSTGAEWRPDGHDQKGNAQRSWEVGTIQRWRPTQQLEFTAFHQHSALTRQVEPYFFFAADALPPEPPRNRRLGQRWSNYDYDLSLSGLTAAAKLSEQWRLNAGIFYSHYLVDDDMSELITIIDSSGVGERTALLSANQRYLKTSGELRVLRSWHSAALTHELAISLRGRRNDSRYGGYVEIPLGTTTIATPGSAPRPAVTFDEPLTVDNIEQTNLGIGYRGSWQRRLTLTVGLQKVRYDKSAGTGAQIESGSARPTLYDASLSWRATPGMVLYASVARGLEDSGVAPTNAVNRGEILPAILTRQRELGGRAEWSNARLTGAIFDIEKPYAGLLADGRFLFAGTVRHTGAELSVSGSSQSGLSYLFGGLLLDAAIDEHGVASRRPVAIAPWALTSNIDYAPSAWHGWSVDIGANALGRRHIRRDSDFELPERMTFDIGARYRFELTGHRAEVRAQITNVTDEFNWSVDAGESLYYEPSRSVRLYLTVDL